MLEFGTWTVGILGTTLADQHYEAVSYPVSLVRRTPWYHCSITLDPVRLVEATFSNNMPITYRHVRDLSLDSDMEKKVTQAMGGSWSLYGYLHSTQKPGHGDLRRIDHFIPFKPQACRPVNLNRNRDHTEQYF
jgi:hypothetical protein